MELSEIMKLAFDAGASDIHLVAEQVPRLRVDGEMQPLDIPTPAAEAVREMLCGIMSSDCRKDFEEKNDADFSYETAEGRFRVNTFRTRRGVGAVFRLIPTHIKTLDDLGMPPVLKELCAREKGLILVTGPTGSGKSTTLAAMIHHINCERGGHILTVEDPIEFVHESRQCLINQREIGAHTPSFSAALRGALREDPDVILVGEMRDLETMSLAITAAETGHLVLATLHTSSAAKTIHRLIDVFPAEQQEQIRVMFADSMQAIVCQALLKREGGGRVAAMEILLATPAVRNLVREGKVHQIPSAIQTGQRSGMQPMDVALQDLVKRQIVSREEARAYASTPDLFQAGGLERGAAGNATARPLASR